nr:4-hydroxybenzoate 3-monooxygenase [Nocardia bovistercoris]
MASAQTRTEVGIVGAGPAGLMLAHLLANAGIESVVIDNRTRAAIEATHRAGILEDRNMRLLVESGASDRILRHGSKHAGIDLRFGGHSHRIDFSALVGAAVWLYPQTEIFADLADARERNGGDVRFGVTDTRLVDPAGDRPAMSFTDSDGHAREVRCEVIVGADGSRGVCRSAMPTARRTFFHRAYPFAWFGVLVAAPPSAAELVYAHSDRGFALISQRTPSLQRMYFQCDPDEDVSRWPDDRIWDELQARVRGADDFALREGPITDKSVLPFRSFVCEPMRHGGLVLAGDAAHTVPPTGAKGLNLALADARILADVVERAIRTGDREVLDEYGPRALAGVWRAQYFSYWMTTMLHRAPDATAFDLHRQRAELRAVANSAAGATFLAEGYTGLGSSSG